MNWRKWILSYGGSGLCPVWAGAAGSLAASATLAAIWFLGGMSSQTTAWQGLLLAGAAMATIACVTLAPWACHDSGKKDPQFIVMDEVAGTCVTLFCLPMGRPWLAFVVAYLGFRFFDGLKPPPVRQLEKLPAGWGIVADDLAAGVLANIVCQIVLRFGV